MKPILLLLAAATLAAASPAKAGDRPARHGRAPPRLMASPLEAAPVQRHARPGEGRVEYATGSRAYLNVGSEDGLAVGMELVFRRNGAPSGRCVVDLVSGHHGSCPETAARPGDTFSFEEIDRPPEPKVLPTPPPDEELDRRRALVLAAPVAQVEFRPPADRPAKPPRARTVEAGYTHASWTSSTSASSHRESADVIVRGAEVGAGLTLDVDARALRWVQRDRPRFRPNEQTQLYVWQAQLTGAPGPFVLSAGRVMPWTVPGATLFDGALAGAQGVVAGFRAEGGVFGGLVPEPDTTAPNAKRATGGAYWSLDRAFGPGASFRQEGRVAMVRSPELGDRGEVSLAGRLFLRRFDVSAEAHLGAGGKASGLDAARVDAALRPVKGVSVGGSYREAGTTWPQPFEPAAFPGRTRAADGYVLVDVGPWLRVGGTGGLSRDLANRLERRWFGPELGLPRLFGSRGGVTFGYLEESGWLQGRSAWAQATARPWEPLRLVARVTWAHEETLTEDQDDVGLFVAANADVTRHLGLRLSVLARTGLALTTGELEGGGTRPLGITGFATLFGSY